jgi:general secretion pathway protein M
VNALRQRWAALSARERRLVALAAAVIGAALLFAVGIAPAWRTLQAAPAEHARLDAELQSMQRLAAEARALRAVPPMAPGLAAQSLQAATARLEGARLMLQGERAVLTIDGASGEAIAQWLAEARQGARARPVEARLQGGDDGLYKGSIVVALGGRP